MNRRKKKFNKNGIFRNRKIQRKYNGKLQKNTLDRIFWKQTIYT